MGTFRFGSVSVFAPMTYDTTRARKHAFVEAARDLGLEALYVEAPNSKSRHVAGGGRPLLNRPGEAVLAETGVRVLSLPKKWGLGGFRAALPKRRMEAVQSRWLRAALTRSGLRPPTLAIVTSARWTSILRDVSFDALVYDRNDEADVLRGWLSREEYRAREAELLERADLLISPSQALLHGEHQDRPGLATRMIRNGVTPEGFERERARPVPELEDESRPVVGFMGTVAWFTDTELIAESADAYPEIHFVLVGPVQSGVDIEPLRSRANVSLWGPVPYERVPSIVNRFDACLIPFRVGPISDSLCPVKFFEYLYLGKPVVSTPMPELEEFEHLYYSGRDSFVTSIERAITEKDDELAAERQRVGRDHAWDTLFLQLLEAVPEDTAASG